MYKSKFFSIGLVAICFAVAAGVATAQETITNGDFELVTSGTFDSWSYGSAGTATAYDMSPLDGSHSANIVAGEQAIWQQVSETGFENFSWELDFATLPFYTGSRSLHVGTFATDPSNLYSGSVDSIRVIPSGEIQFHNGGWVGTGLISDITPNVGTGLVFNGETLVLNHLEFVGNNYGKDEQSISITLNGNTVTYTAADSTTGKVSVLNVPPKYFTAIGLASASDYLIDNVSCSGEESIPPTLTKPTGESLLTNGDFEAVTEGVFDSWDYSTTASATLATTPIEGNNSANLVAAEGVLSQQIADAGVADFYWELDFAALPFSSGSRSLHITTYETDPAADPYAGNIDSIRLVPSGQIEYHSGSAWVGTGLFPNLTTDTGTPLFFDGETPVVNHLTFTGNGYGTDEQLLEITLNGESYIGTGAVSNVAPKYFGALGLVSGVDYQIDNVFVAIEEQASQLPGDANLDNTVDVSDLGILATHYGAADGKTWGEGDFNDDGAVDVSDLGILATNYGTTAAAVSYVPEPSMVILMVSIILPVFLIRRRK